MEKRLSPVIRLEKDDNVVVARHEIPAGTEIPEEGITTLQVVPAGHKVATRLIRKGEAVLKYNTVIGYAATLGLKVVQPACQRGEKIAERFYLNPRRLPELAEVCARGRIQLVGAESGGNEGIAVFTVRREIARRIVRRRNEFHFEQIEYLSDGKLRKTLVCPVVYPLRAVAV